MSYWDRFKGWFWTTSMMIGVPITVMLLAWGAGTAIFSTTCTIAGYKCQYGIAVDTILANYFANGIRGGKDQRG